MRRRSFDDGYAMAALLVMLAVMSIMLTVALPSWRQMVKREKEAELVFRGQQYARAIALFQRKYANALPPSIDVLVEQRFLRKKYKDPITGDDFQPIPATSLALTPTSPQAASTPGAAATPVQPQVPSSRSTTPGPGGGGGIAGVASKSKDESIRIFNGRQHYNEWHFTYLAFAPRPGAGPGVPGGVRPGGATPVVPGQRGLPLTPNLPTTPGRGRGIPD